MPPTDWLSRLRPSKSRNLAARSDPWRFRATGYRSNPFKPRVRVRGGRLATKPFSEFNEFKHRRLA
ncbi:MAG: hypothetical protein AAF532_06825 [Planctomycetota bacterium]